MDIAATIILLIFSSCVLLLCATFFRICSSPVEAIHLSFVVIALMIVLGLLLLVLYLIVLFVSVMMFSVVLLCRLLLYP